MLSEVGEGFLHRDGLHVDSRVVGDRLVDPGAPLQRPAGEDLRVDPFVHKDREQAPVGQRHPCPGARRNLRSQDVRPVRPVEVSALVQPVHPEGFRNPVHRHRRGRADRVG